MPETFEEGHLRFRFDDSWYAIKYDEHPDYRERIERLDGTKAVDFVAVHRDSQLFLIEVKDFRGHRIENQPRLREGELAIEVGQKVRDTVAGIARPTIEGTMKTGSEPCGGWVVVSLRSASFSGWNKTFLPALAVAGTIKHLF